MTRPLKQPTIRAGQYVPYRKGTQAEVDRRRGYVVRLLARGVTKTGIHMLVRRLHAREWRTADRDIALVRRAAK